MANTQKAPASVGAISSFAHLAGVLAAKADNDTEEKKDEEDRKEDEKEDTEAKKKKAKGSAKAEDEEACDEGDDMPEKKGKKAKAEKEKDTSDDDSDYDDKKARHAERVRIHAIMTCIGAKHAVEEAERLSFSTDMSAEQAIGHLNVKAIELLSAKALKPAPKVDALRDRMANIDVQVGPGDPKEPSGGTGNAYQDQVSMTAAAIIAAGKRRRGEKA